LSLNIALLEKLTKRNHLYALQAKLQPMLFGGLWTDNFSILKTGIMLSSGMRRHTFFFVRKRGYTLHIDAPDGGTKMETEKVYAMPFAKIYPILVAKAVGKGRTQAEVDEIIGWLTGYSACGVKQEGIEEPLMKEIRYLESWWMSWLRAKRWRRSSGQTNEEKQPITHRQRMWYNP
jgi:hypothetical protein